MSEQAQAIGSEGEPLELTITRVLPAPRDLVFRMYAERDHARRWYCPAPFTVEEMELDFRPGGTWHANIRSGEGKAYRMLGAYREIAPPERLVFTHFWRRDDDSFSPETVVTVTLEEVDGGTRLTFHQTGFAEADAREAHVQGWSGSLDRLEALVAEMPEAAPTG